jgi:PIN domain nuclease of toxin-antitoxin system
LPRFLLDTHVLIRWFEAGGKLSPAQRRAIARAGPEHPLFVSDISLVEIAVLHERGRIRFSIPLREWLERAVSPPLVQLCAVTPAVAAEIPTLPPEFPRDPADRVIACTARTLGATLVTCDQRIIESKAVPTLS